MKSLLVLQNFTVTQQSGNVLLAIPHLAIYFSSPFGRYPTFPLVQVSEGKSFLYAKRIVPLVSVSFCKLFW